MSTVPPSTPPPGGTYTPPPPPPPPPVGGGAAPGSDRTLMVVLAYLGILCLIPLLTKKEDRDIQWHAKNGLSFVIAEIVLWIVLIIVGLVVGRIPIAGCGVMSVLWCVFGIGILVVHIMAIMKALNGQQFRLPVVSDFADKM